MTKTETLTLVNRFEKSAYNIGWTLLRKNVRAAAKSTFAIGGLSCSADRFVVKESSVLRISICVGKPALRKSAKH